MLSCLLGVELLIEYYQQEKSSDELPCQLDKPCAGGVSPPPLSLSIGYTNVLHKAISEGACGLCIVYIYLRRKILMSPVELSRERLARHLMFHDICMPCEGQPLGSVL